MSIAEKSPPPNLGGMLCLLSGEIRSWFESESTAWVNRNRLARGEGTPKVIWDTGEVPVVRMN